MISLHNMLPFELTKDTPYLALSGELWSVFYEYFNRNWSCYKGFLLYVYATKLFSESMSPYSLQTIKSATFCGTNHHHTWKCRVGYCYNTSCLLIFCSAKWCTVILAITKGWWVCVILQKMYCFLILEQLSHFFQMLFFLTLLNINVIFLYEADPI